MSINLHHVGGVPQQFKVPACAIKINGVAIQCNIQSVLATAPILSGFCFIKIINFFIYAAKINNLFLLQLCCIIFVVWEL